MKRKGAVQPGCPCGGADYAACCGRFHRGLQLPDDAAQLMRSRYSAYVLNEIDYLRETWHPATLPPDLDEDLESRWLGLTVKGHAQQDDTHAEVEFVARFKRGGRAYRLHERSRFVREPRRPGEPPRWLYVDGDMLEGGGGESGRDGRADGSAHASANAGANAASDNNINSSRKGNTTHA